MSALLRAFEHHETLAWWLIGISVLSLVGTLVLLPWSLARLPADYFTGKPAKPKGRGAATQILWRVGKNVLGAFFIVTGVLMLVLPGQGVVTILAGLLLIDFPRKRRVVRWLVGRGPVLRYINARRRKAGRAPLRM